MALPSLTANGSLISIPMILLSLFASLTTAAPATLSIRDAAERFFLTDCRTGDSSPWTLSTVAYYTNNANEIEGLAPDATGSLGELVHWSYQPLNVNMSNGDFFSVDITDGTSVNGALAGEASNKDSKSWKCYYQGPPDAGGEVYVFSQDPFMDCYKRYECCQTCGN